MLAVVLLSVALAGLLVRHVRLCVRVQSIIDMAEAAQKSALDHQRRALDVLARNAEACK